MFEPMPSMIRRERERQELTLEELSNMSNVSRSRLSAFERGEENVSLEFVVKVANALGMKKLRVGGMEIEGAPADLAVLIAASDALEMARRIIDSAASSRDELDRMSAKVSALLDRTLTPVPDPGIAQAAERLVSRSHAEGETGRALRELADARDVRAPRKAAVTQTARKRAR